MTQLSGVLREIALSTTGFMPENEGDALFAAALNAGVDCPALPFVEIGSYCGRSTVWFGEAARLSNTVLHAVDHHGGSEENQPGWEWHDQTLVDPVTGRLNTLPYFEHTMQRANLTSVVKAVVGDSPVIAGSWKEQIGMLFIDGGHGREVARNDYVAWTPHVAVGGTLAIHDVFSDPALGGQAPYEEIYLAAINSKNFVETSCTGSLKILQRVK